MIEDVSEQMHAAYLSIAVHNGCNVDDVYEAFDDYPVVKYLTPKVIRECADESEHLYEAATHLANAYKSLKRVPPNVRQSFYELGSITLGQIQITEEMIVGLARFLESRADGIERRGGKNWAAEHTAGGIAQLFESLGRKLSFGHNDGSPTTDFGRSVLQAFEALEIEGNWREPAKRASQQTKTP